MPLEEKCCPKKRGLGNGCTHIAGVLVLAGLELILFIVACMGLCFGSVTKRVLIIQVCFSYC